MITFTFLIFFSFYLILNAVPLLLAVGIVSSVERFRRHIHFSQAIAVLLSTTLSLIGYIVYDGSSIFNWHILSLFVPILVSFGLVLLLNKIRFGRVIA